MPLTPAAARSTRAVVAAILGRGEQGHGSPFAVTRRRSRRLGSTSLPVGHERDGCAKILRVLGKPGSFDPAPALTGPSLVITQDQVAGVGECVGELTEHGNAGDRFITIERARSRDENDGRQPLASLAGGLRKGSDEVEAVRRNMHLLVAIPRDDDAPGRNRRDIVADEFERLRGHTEAQQPPGLIRPDLGVQLGASRRGERHVRAPRGDAACDGLNLFGL